MGPRLAPLGSRTSTPGSGHATPYDFTDVGGTLFFAADNGTTGFELWKAGDFPPGTEPSDPGTTPGGNTPEGDTPGGSTPGGNTSGGGSPSGGSGATGPSSAEILGALGADTKGVGRAVAKLRIGALLKSSGFTAKGLDALSAGRFTVRLTAAASGEARGAAQAVIAKASRSVAAAGTYKLKVKLTKAGKRLLRRAKRVKATLKLSFAPSAGQLRCGQQS